MEPQARITLQKIQDQLEEENLQEAVQLLTAEHPADVADILMALEEPERLALLGRLSLAQTTATLRYLDSVDAAQLAEHLDPAVVAAALDQSEPDIAADVLGDMATQQAAEVLGRMQQAQRVAPLLLHPEESAAGVMTPDYLALDGEQTVEETIAYLRQTKPPSDTIYYLFVVDGERHLMGVVNLRDLITAPPETTLRAIMNAEVVSIQAGADREEAAHLMRHYDIMTLPVVDEQQRLLGMITFDDAADVLEEETTEDIYHMVGLSEDERAFSPLKDSLRRRYPWLHIDLIMAFAVAGVVNIFEPTIERVAALAVFMPVAARLGGNAGAQTFTVIVRGLALGEIGVGDALRALAREVPLGVMNGVSLGIITGVVAFLWKGNAWIGVAIGLAIIGNLVVATAAGVLIPLVLKKLGVDPALASSILLTTFTDVCGVFFFLGLGTLLLPRLLGM